MPQFKRERRYYVAKATDVERFLTTRDRVALGRILGRLDMKRHLAGKPPLECVVVEADWPEYEPTWDAIAARMANSEQA